MTSRASDPDSPDSYTQRADQMTSVLDDILHQQAPPPHLVSGRDRGAWVPLFGLFLPRGGFFLLLADDRRDGLQLVALG